MGNRLKAYNQNVLKIQRPQKGTQRIVITKYISPHRGDQQKETGKYKGQSSFINK
jgi:hypothetical protein